jgi:hypothetical protein
MTPSGPELTVVLPVYNEEEIIGEVLEDWTGELERHYTLISKSTLIMMALKITL